MKNTNIKSNRNEFYGDFYENHDKIEIPIMYYIDDETNKKVYDLEGMANEFENMLSRITKVSVMCSIVEDDE